MYSNASAEENKSAKAAESGKTVDSKTSGDWTAVDASSIFGISGTNIVDAEINAIAYGNGKFVAGGRDGKIAYSTGK